MLHDEPGELPPGSHLVVVSNMRIVAQQSAIAVVTPLESESLDLEHYVGWYGFTASTLGSARLKRFFEVAGFPMHFRHDDHHLPNVNDWFRNAVEFSRGKVLRATVREVESKGRRGGHLRVTTWENPGQPAAAELAEYLERRALVIRDPEVASSLIELAGRHLREAAPKWSNAAIIADLLELLPGP